MHGVSATHVSNAHLVQSVLKYITFRDYFKMTRSRSFSVPVKNHRSLLKRVYQAFLKVCVVNLVKVLNGCVLEFIFVILSKQFIDINITF